MPALPPPSLLDSLVSRSAAALDVVASSASSLVSRAGPNHSHDALQVVCAWPVSSQYGPGSRFLYYVLIGACVIARKSEWLKNVCLAAALLLPAVAALHGIALAAYHHDDAVDLDVFGAFQLCAIGIVAAPVTVRMSKTYFYDPGRNTIFLWAALILAGLLSLTVEFYRTTTTGCSLDNDHHPLSSNSYKFPYGNAQCDLVCNERDTRSLMRGGSANNVYVIPAPTILTFGSATLLSAACCVQSILWLVSMWNKVLEINWKARFGSANNKRGDEPIEGTNGATTGNMKGINDRLRYFMSVAAIPVFGAAGLAILIVGEINFFSGQLMYETEPMASIGQWSPIAGTGLAAVGSLYMLLAADVEKVKEEENPTATPPEMHQCTCAHQDSDNHSLNSLRSQHIAVPRASFTGSFASRVRMHDDSTADRTHTVADGDDDHLAPPPEHSESPYPQEITFADLPSPRQSPIRGSGDLSRSFSNELTQTITRTSTTATKQRADTMDDGSRRRVAKALMAFGEYVGTPSDHLYDDSGFKTGEAANFPEIPGENQRNERLGKIKEQYNQSRLKEQRSRASFTGSVASGIDDTGEEGNGAGSSISRSHSPRPPRSRSTSPYPMLRREASNTLPIDRSVSAESPTTLDRRPRRRDTLEVPSPTHHSFHHHRRNSPSAPSFTSILAAPGDDNPPIIVASPEPDSPSPTQSPRQTPTSSLGPSRQAQSLPLPPGEGASPP